LKSVVKTIPAGTNLYKKGYVFGALTSEQLSGLYSVHIQGAKAVNASSSSSYFDVSTGYFYINTMANEASSGTFTITGGDLRFKTTMWGGSSGSTGYYYISPSSGQFYVYSGSTSANYTAATDIVLTFYYLN
jgi:hypothetical protein